MQRQPALTVSHSTLTDHRIRRTPDEPYPEIAFKESLPGTGFIHVNAVPGKDSGVPRWRCCRRTARNSFDHIWNTRTTIFLSWTSLAKANNKDPFVLSAIAQKAVEAMET